MNENRIKTDKGLKVILSICFLGIITVVILLFSIFFKDCFTSLEDYEYSYGLKPGFYEVGVHIPAGTYVVNLEKDKEAKFTTYKTNDSNLYYYREYFVCDNEKGEKDILEYRPYFSMFFPNRSKNITLKEGQVLEIEPQTSFTFYTNNIENTSYDPIEVTYSDITIGSYVFWAGKDFPAGVYDIIYEPKDSNQTGTVKCEIRNIDVSYFTENSYFFDCEGENGTQMIAHGMPFTPGSSISVGDLNEITLVPTKYISETFNSLTWEADSN